MLPVCPEQGLGFGGLQLTTRAQEQPALMGDPLWFWGGHIKKLPESGQSGEGDLSDGM